MAYSEEDVKNIILSAIKEHLDEDCNQYIKEAEEQLKESLTKYDKLKTDVKKRSMESKSYKKMCNNFGKVLQISENNKTIGVDEILACIYEMERITLENQKAENKFWENKRIIEEFLERKSNSCDNMAERKDEFITRQLEDLISLGEEIMQTMKVNDSLKEEDELLNKKLEIMELRMKFLEEDGRKLEELEQDLEYFENELSNIDNSPQSVTINDKFITNSKLSQLMEKLDSETKKNAELEFEVERINNEIERIDSLFNQLEFLKKLIGMDYSEMKNFDLTEVFKSYPLLADEIVKFKDTMNKLEERKLCYQKQFEELELLCNQKMKEFEKLNAEKKEMLKTINELDEEVDSLKEKCGDKAYMLDNMILEKIKKESTMLEECLNITRQIEEGQKKK
ncbi:Hypothetical protein SRAE_1000227800 [Strongyloides ratti]|uniref:Uncharacterized protein n=1 Tax=Strongyloides ratti TaxID=34506 RepID=A0A090L2T7_STRRB|nr:Hypothetical protein SRAE_1000227800 [Strongyloides ratti]CEF64022.1 Hypothetical protein SRAE_1000227800 [Strongyloides ratti]